MAIAMRYHRPRASRRPTRLGLAVHARLHRKPDPARAEALPESAGLTGTVTAEWPEHEHDACEHEEDEAAAQPGGHERARVPQIRCV